MILKKYLLAISALCAFVGCTERIVLDLKTSDPKLVINASALLDTATNSASPMVVFSADLNLSTPFYDQKVRNPSVANAKVFVTENDGTTSTKHQLQQDGAFYWLYTLTVPYQGPNTSYALEIEFEGDTYQSAPETIIPTPAVTRSEAIRNTTLEDLNNGNNGRVGSTNDDDKRLFLDVNIYFRDDPNVNNFYLITLSHPSVTGDFFTIRNDDRLLKTGDISLQLLTSFREKDITRPFKIDQTGSFYSISRAYFNFITVLSTQISREGGNPFGGDTPKDPIRGNVINVTNPDKFPYGFFLVAHKQPFPVSYSE